MKNIIVAEQREGKLLDSIYELLTFAESLGGQSAVFMVGSEGEAPLCELPVYLASADKHGEFNPDAHKQLLLTVIEKFNADRVIFSHSSYGWDMAPRIAVALKAAQVSEALGYKDGQFTVPSLNSKMRRDLKPDTPKVVVTLQAGAVNGKEPAGSPSIEPVDIDEGASRLEFTGYEQEESTGVDLTKAELIVSAGRGVGKKDDVQIVADLAEAFGAELGASRPVVDAGWLDKNRQVGVTGQSVAPKLYLACGISGAIQHIAGMKKSEFIVAINTDKLAPIGEVADVLVVADLKKIAPILTEKVKAIKNG